MSAPAHNRMRLNTTSNHMKTKQSIVNGAVNYARRPGNRDDDQEAGVMAYQEAKSEGYSDGEAEEMADAAETQFRGDSESEENLWDHNGP